MLCPEELDILVPTFISLSSSQERDKGLVAPHIPLFFTFGSHISICCLKLRNGFKQNSKQYSVSPPLYTQRGCCSNHVRYFWWFFLGFLSCRSTYVQNRRGSVQCVSCCDGKYPFRVKIQTHSLTHT